MRLDSVLSRLQAHCPSAEVVRMAYGLSTVETSQLPAIYLHPTFEEARQSDADNFVVQTIECKFSVMLAADAQTMDAIEDLRDEVRNALLGYSISSVYDAIEFVSGEVLEMSASTIWWRDTFITNHYVRQQ